MQTNTTPTLLQAIRRDPDTGLRWAMRDYAALVRGIARRILPGHDRDIEECTADVFVALWRNAARLEATGTPVRAWLIVTARNTAINRYRALQRHDTLPLTDELAATIAELPADEKAMFLEDLGIAQSGLDRLIQASYDLLGLISFLTAGEDECRAWTITRGTRAPQAAGKIHTDFERGFIRAETIAFEDLKACGSMAAAREKGLIRSEGKDYVVRDGDIILFRFNV